VTAVIYVRTRGSRFAKKILAGRAVAILREVIGQRTEGPVFVNPRTGQRYKSIGRTFRRAVNKLELKVQMDGESRLGLDGKNDLTGMF